MPAPKARTPAVAGSFYPSNSDQLARQIDEYCTLSGPQHPAFGCVVPHAGYMYSGHVAGAVYSALEIPRRCILLGPRHYPQGQSMAILTGGIWQTPFGEVAVDSDLASKLAHACPLLREDSVAHEREHSLEVQLPFLQRVAGRFQFVPVVLASDRYPVLEEIGRAVAHTVLGEPDPVLVIASSDMNHYESDAITRVKDGYAIERILALDARGLYDVVRRESITMCGYAATVAMLVAARERGATSARLIRYATSGDNSGNLDQVVGYAGIIVD
jgi:MEMO1 family protein